MTQALYDVQTLPNRIYYCYESPFKTTTKPDFQSLHLEIIPPHRMKAVELVSFTADYLDSNDQIHLENQAVTDGFIANISSN